MPTVKEGFVQEIIGRYEGDPGMLIPMMQDLQAEYGFLPPEELRRLSGELGVALTRIYGVATFYSSFRMAPRGQHEVTLCMGTVCYLKGSPKISEAICSEYGIRPGGTTPDRLFTLQAVNCVGACALAPVMIVDGKYYDGVTPDSALEVLHALAAGQPEVPASAAPDTPALNAPELNAPATVAEQPTAGSEAPSSTTAAAPRPRSIRKKAESPAPRAAASAKKRASAASESAKARKDAGKTSKPGSKPPAVKGPKKRSHP
jgi:NADH:ubiquinone oxidoreductase subunit E